MSNFRWAGKLTRTQSFIQIYRVQSIHLIPGRMELQSQLCMRRWRSQFIQDTATTLLLEKDEIYERMGNISSVLEDEYNPGGRCVDGYRTPDELIYFRSPGSQIGRWKRTD
jgi:hypothetical protein